MKKTEFFSAENTELLQQKVNKWLGENKDIGIIDSGMTVGNDAKANYNFYVLYEAMEEVAAIAVSEQVENIIPTPESLSETTDTQLQ